MTLGKTKLGSEPGGGSPHEQMTVGMGLRTVLLLWFGWAVCAESDLVSPRETLIWEAHVMASLM